MCNVANRTVLGQVWQSDIGLFCAFQPATDGRIVDPQMFGDRLQPIPIAAIGQEDPRRLRLLSLKQDKQGGPLGLRLPTRNLADHASGLMLRDEVPGPQVDGDYRVIDSILDKERRIDIAAVRHRREVYG